MFGPEPLVLPLSPRFAARAFVSPLYGIQKGAAFPLWFLIQKNASRMEGVFY
jgi:hypothetical protein